MVIGYRMKTPIIGDMRYNLRVNFVSMLKEKVGFMVLRWKFM